MEIKSLRYFLAVAREENMTKAADMLHVTQPTLSKTLKSLEDELGKKLFKRHSFSIYNKGLNPIYLHAFRPLISSDHSLNKSSSNT